MQFVNKIKLNSKKNVKIIGLNNYYQVEGYTMNEPDNSFHEN